MKHHLQYKHLKLKKTPERSFKKASSKLIYIKYV